VLEGAQVAGRVQPGTAILRYSGKPTPDMDTLITLIKAGGDETAPRSMEVLTPAGRKKKLRVRPGRLGVALGSSTTDLVATEGTGPLVVLDVVDEAAEFLEIKRHQHRFGEAGPVDRLNALARELAKRTHEQRFARFPERLAATAMTLDAFGRRVGTLLSTRRLSDLRRLIASDPLRAAAHWEVLCIRLLAAGERPVEGEVFELFETYSAVLSGVTKDDRFAVWARTLGAPEAKTHLRETFELLQQAGDLTLSPSSAFPRIEKAEALAVAAGFHWLQHRCRIERLATRAANLQFEEAVAELKTLVEEAGLERLPLSRLDLLGAQARLHAGAGEASRATLLLRERLQLTESVLGNEGAALCRALIALARDALLRGEAQGALSLVRRPLHLADIFDHHLERAEAFILEAEALLELGRASAAVEPLDAALQLLRALMKHSVGSFIIAGEDHFERLGGTRAQGRRVQDVESARRSEALARAKVYEALGRVKDAREQYEKASFVWRLVEFELRQKRWSEAFSALVMAMDGQVARKDYDAIFEGLVLFARFFRDREEHRSALWFCLRAISLSENLRSQLAIDARDGPTRERFLQRTLEPYRWAIEALFELERAGQPFSEPRRAARPGFVEAGSWQMSLWKRSMDGLAELVPAFPLSKLGGSYAVATLALADAMRARTLTEQLVQPASDEPTTTIGWKGEDLRFLGKGQTLAVYSWLSEQVAMWRVRPGEPVRSWSIPLRSAPGDADLLTQLERFLAGLASESCGGEQEPRGLLPATADPCTSPEESGVDLFARLLSPVLEGVPAGEHLLISPDGPLLRSPFAAWPLPDGAGWVGDRYSVSYLYSLRLAREDATSARPSEAAKGGILVISDPIFEVSDPRLRGVDAAPSSWVIAAKGANAPSAAAAWRRLPGTTSEVENIRSAARDHGVGVVVLSGLCATEEAVASQRFSEHRRIHFATHGALPGAVSFLSQPALVLSQYGSSQAGHDGLLTTREVARLDLRDVELVVLSACETGLGESLGGEGLQSLGRAFRLAGARGLVTSLWRVDDKATASLMGAFYRHLLSGAPASSALQRAQTEMRKNNPKYAAPYYWAAFRYLGM